MKAEKSEKRTTWVEMVLHDLEGGVIACCSCGWRRPIERSSMVVAGRYVRWESDRALIAKAAITMEGHLLAHLAEDLLP